MTRIAIGLTEDFADWECALLMASAHGYLGIEVVTATPDASAVASMGGLTVSPAFGFDDIMPEDVDILVFAGGEIWDKQEAPDLSAIVRRFRAAGKPVAGICGATLGLARTGLLNEVVHTSNSLDFLKTAGVYDGQTLYRDQPMAVNDHRVITAPGTAPVSFATEILREIGVLGPEAEMHFRSFGNEFQ